MYKVIMDWGEIETGNSKVNGYHAVASSDANLQNRSGLE